MKKLFPAILSLLFICSCSIFHKVHFQTDQFDFELDLRDSTLSIQPLSIALDQSDTSLAPLPAGMAISDFEIGSPDSVQILNFGQLGFSARFSSVDSAKYYWYGLSRSSGGTDLIFRAMGVAEGNVQTIDFISLTDYDFDQEFYLYIAATADGQRAGKPTITKIERPIITPGQQAASWQFDPLMDPELESFIDSTITAIAPVAERVFSPAFSSIPILFSESQTMYVFQYKKWKIEVKPDIQVQTLVHEWCHFLQGLFAPSINYDGSYNYEAEWLAEGIAQAGSRAILRAMGENAHSSFDHYYDFANQRELSCGHIRSDRSAMGMPWPRYEMASSVFEKLAFEYESKNPGKHFFFEFNTRYFKALNVAKQDFDRVAIAKTIMGQLVPIVERQTFATWMEHQMMSAGIETRGQKVFVLHQPYFSTQAFTDINTLFYYETFECGDNWFCDSTERHTLNGLMCKIEVIEDWSDKLAATTAFQTLPYPFDNGFSSLSLILSTDTAGSGARIKSGFEKQGRNAVLMEINKTGLYRIVIDFGIVKKTIYRILGNELIDRKGEIIVGARDGEQLVTGMNGGWTRKVHKAKNGVFFTGQSSGKLKLMLHLLKDRKSLYTGERNIYSNKTQLIFIGGNAP